MNRVSFPRASAATAAVMTLLLGGAAIAWACTPQAMVQLSPQAGPARSQATVTGNRWGSGPGAQPVEIRWNNPAGPLLATAEGPTFSVEITIPDVPEGVYYVVAYQLSHGAGNESGHIENYSPTYSGFTRTSFEVVAPQRAPAGSGRQGPTSQTSGGPSSTTVNGEDSSAPTRDGETSATFSAGESEDPSTVPARAKRRTTEPGASGRIAPPTQNASQNTNRQAPPGGPESSSDRVSFPTTGTTAFTDNGQAPAAAVRGNGRQGAVFAPSVPRLNPATEPITDAREQSASNDLWSGFSSGDSLVPSLSTPAAAASGQGTGLTAGIALLSAGMLALLAGVTVAQVRKRRATA